MACMEYIMEGMSYKRSASSKLPARGAKPPGMQVGPLAGRFGFPYLFSTWNPGVQNYLACRLDSWQAGMRAAHGISHGRYVLHAVLELETVCQGGKNA